MVLVLAALQLLVVIPILGILPFVFLALGVLEVVIPLRSWQLVPSGPGSRLFFASFACSLLLIASIFMSGVLPDRISVWASSLVGLAFALSFALGVLRSGVAPRWVAWSGIVGFTIGHVLSFLDSLLVSGSVILPGSEAVSGVALVLGSVFWVGLGVSLVRDDGRGHTEQALPADGGRV